MFYEKASLENLLIRIYYSLTLVATSSHTHRRSVRIFVFFITVSVGIVVFKWFEQYDSVLPNKFLKSRLSIRDM